MNLRDRILEQIPANGITVLDLHARLSMEQPAAFLCALSSLQRDEVIRTNGTRYWRVPTVTATNAWRSCPICERRHQRNALSGFCVSCEREFKFITTTNTVKRATETPLGTRAMTPQFYGEPTSPLESAAHLGPDLSGPLYSDGVA